MNRQSTNRCEVRKFLEDVSVWIDGCWHWIGDKNKNKIGYGCFYCRGTRILAHRYMWELVNNQTIPDNMIILHKCDQPICVNPDHLILGTQQDNIKDMWTKNRGNTKLSFNDKNVIRAKYKNNNITLKEIAMEFDISFQRVSQIIHQLELEQQAGENNG